MNKLNPAEQFVSYALNIGAMELLPNGRELKSKRISPYFFNSGLFNTGESISNLAKAYAGAINRRPFPRGVIFGPAYKGIPLATAVAQALGGKIGYAFNRKEAKDHGEGGVIVGASLKGEEVIIVDDVMTTGTSSGEAVEITIANGGIPIACIIAFDRQERGKEGKLSAVQEFQKNYGIPVYAAATLTDLILFLEKTPAESGDDNIGEIIEKILAYRKEYGVD
ncbi:MAG: orotate phosphoribosyltransferase [Candidatus Paceibacterota bacterium]|jgi:orotate phosphoribosyltransferase